MGNIFDPNHEANNVDPNEREILAAALHLLRARGRPVFGGYLVDLEELEKELGTAEPPKSIGQRLRDAARQMREGE